MNYEKEINEIESVISSLKLLLREVKETKKKSEKSFNSNSTIRQRQKASEIFGDSKIDDFYFTKEDMKSFADWCRNGLLNTEYSYLKLDEHLEKWEQLKENRCDMCGNSGVVKTGEFEYSTCPCVSDHSRD